MSTYEKIKVGRIKAKRLPRIGRIKAIGIKNGGEDQDKNSQRRYS